MIGGGWRVRGRAKEGGRIQKKGEV